MLTDPSWIGETQAFKKHLSIGVWAIIQEVCNHRQETIESDIVKRLVLALHKGQYLFADLSAVPLLQKLFIGHLLESRMLDADITLTHAPKEVLETDIISNA